MSYLQLEHIKKHFGGRRPFSLQDVSFGLEQGEVLALVGESGSGKTTILRIIGGLEYPENGQVILNGTTLNDENKFVKASKRGIGYVFQEYALFPHLTVAENVAYGVSSLPASERKARVAKMTELVGLGGYEDRYPHQLSGGEQQRVALARSLATQPALLLLDEPFSNLDSLKKEKVRREIKNIIKQTNTTAIFVTHDTKEALSIADKIIVLKKGAILQEGSPSEIYRQPVNEYVASFFGKANILPLEKENGSWKLPFGDFRVDGNYQNAMACIRPENFVISETGSISGKIIQRDFFGDYQEVVVEVAGKNGQAIPITLHAPVNISLESEVKFDLVREGAVVVFEK